LIASSVALLLMLGLAVSVGAKTNSRADLQDARRLAQIEQFNLTGMHDWVGKVGDIPPSTPSTGAGTLPRRSVGSALSPDAGIGVGISVALTFEDMQYGFPVGRYVSHYWNGETGGSAQAGVHFCYELTTDTVPGDVHASLIRSGYNVYDATVTENNWPRGQDVGCGLQSTDTAGTGQWVNLDVLGNTRVVMTARTNFFSPLLPSGEEFRRDNLFFYQASPFNCVYDPRSSLNTTFIDSTSYRPHFVDPSAGNYAVQPEVATQWDGSNTVVHVLIGEGEPFDPPLTPDYAAGGQYRVFMYYRKLGDLASDNSWSSGVIVDSVMQVYATNGVTIFPSPNSGRVCISYSNPGFYGTLLNNIYDTDIFYRESTDYGLTWGPKVNVTNYKNALDGDPAHFKGWVESPCFYDSNDDLHIIWTGTPTSANPYFDGFNWNDFDTDVYHWARSSDEIVRFAKGTYLNDDMLTGSVNTLHCGFGNQYAGYIAFIWLSECDGKLYAIWNQYHPWLNYGDYNIQPELLTDCAYTGERLSMANWEIMMSVASIESSSLWDPPRHISNTFTPDCGLAGDPDASGPCGNEYKPAVEKYALDETGLDLYWPEDAIVDLTPEGEPAYSGGWYLNLEYIDDQFPGSFVRESRASNDFGSLNSEKWVRLACVEPVEASIIAISPRNINWPQWVELGQSNSVPLTVINEGNVTLNVSQIGTDDDGGGWLSVTENPTPTSPFQVTAGVVNTATFDIVMDATGLSQTTWLDGLIWLKSDAANTDSIALSIHVLAADAVEPVAWDTVMTHENMFEVYFDPEGECIALAVGNFGELGYGALTQGGVNMDYGESGLECGGRQRDSIYLYGATAFTILADDASGTNAVLTQVQTDASQGDETGFDPIGDKGSIAGGLGTGVNGKDYDSVYTGKFVNRDTTIAMERIVYGPRSADPANETINFVVIYTKVYSGDGQAHNHVTIGNACDWDVPAENPPDNTSGVSSGGFVWVRGTDTTGVLSCQSHTNRYGTEAFGGGYTSTEWQGNNCINGSTFHSANVLYQILMVDTTAYRDGTPLVPAQPNPLVWWTETGVPGLNADATTQDQAIWFTYVHDYDLGATDTLHYWTVMSSVRNGTLADLEAQVSYAKCWYTETVRGCDCGCCVGRVGDANGQSGDEPTISDISVLIDAKFITGTCVGKIPCLAEGDTNQSGGSEPTCDDITISDISILIDYLFITGPENATLKTCL